MRWMRRLAVPAGFTAESADVAGARLCWIERPGTATAGTPLLLVPGLGMTFRAYAWLIPHLDAGRRVLIVDPPGCGDSAPLAGSMDAPAQAQHLAAWMHAERIEGVDVVGHSMGAIIAARLAATAPGAIRSVMLLSPSPDGQWPRLSQHMWALARGAIWEAPRTLVQATRDYLTADPAVMVGFTEQLGHRADAVLAQVRAPVTVVRGKNDKVVSHRWCHALAEVSGGRMRTVRRAGHGLPQQRPREVAALIRAEG